MNKTVEVNFWKRMGNPEVMGWAVADKARQIAEFIGTMDGWKATDINLILLKREIEDSEVIDRIMFNNRKAFIFIPPIGAYYPT